MDEDHRRELVRQFTLQAVPFANVNEHSTGDPLDAFVALGEIGPGDDVLDAGCGPGLLAVHLASRARHVTGTDVTPAMLEAARARASEAGVSNATFTHGDMLALPFPDDCFDCVCTRFTFHHVPEVLPAFRELVRVARPGGRIVVVDASPSTRQREEYDRAEIIRDPSHVRALTIEELLSLGESCALGVARVRRFGMSIPLEKQLAASFPAPDGARRLREMFDADVGRDRLGFAVRRVNGALIVTYPLAALAWTKPPVR